MTNTSCGMQCRSQLLHVTGRRSWGSCISSQNRSQNNGPNCDLKSQCNGFTDTHIRTARVALSVGKTGVELERIWPGFRMEVLCLCYRWMAAEVCKRAPKSQPRYVTLPCGAWTVSVLRESIEPVWLCYTAVHSLSPPLPSRGSRKLCLSKSWLERAPWRKGIGPAINYRRFPCK